MASDADVGDDPPPRVVGSPGIDGRSVRSSGTDPPPPNTPSAGSFLDRSTSYLRRSMMNITSRQRHPSHQDLSGTPILPHESRPFDRDVAAHTVTSNQDGSVYHESRWGAFISPESTQQQPQ